MATRKANMLAVEAVPRGVPPLGFAAKVAVAILLCKSGQPLVGVGAKLLRGIGGAFGCCWVVW